MVFIHHPLTQSPSEFNAKTQRRRDAKRVEGTRSSGEVSAAHSGRLSLARIAAPNASVRRNSSTQRPALSESADLASHIQWDWDGTQTSAIEQEARGGTDALRAHRTGRIPAEMNAGVQGGRVSPWGPAIVRLTAGRRITPSNPAKAGFASLRLCVSASLRFLPVLSAFICAICGFSELLDS